ncbi:MAG: DUF4342 domain-containing protein [Paracoccaceae bacterium]
MKKATPTQKTAADPKPADTAEEKRTWIQEIEVSGEQLVKKVKELAAESHVKRIRVIEPDGDIALDIPLSYGAIAGGAFVIAAPVLAVIGALAAFVSKVKIEIVRDDKKT